MVAHLLRSMASSKPNRGLVSEAVYNERKKKIVLTGGTGLLGARVLALLSARHEVHALVRVTPQYPSAGVHYHRVNLSDSWSTDDMPPDVDAIIHLAQSQHAKEYADCAMDIFSVNTGSTAKLLHYAVKAGARHFILASTGGLYGAQPEPITESTRIEPPRGKLKYYFSTKHAAELLADAYAENLTVLRLRPFFIYGPGQRETMLIPRLIDSVRNRRPIMLQGDAGITINPIHVDDAAAAVEAGLDVAESRAINVAGPAAISLREIAERIGAGLGVEPVYDIECKRSECIVADITEMRNFLVTPTIAFATGVLSVLRHERGGA